jgi:clathrin heavy chain
LQRKIHAQKSQYFFQSRTSYRDAIITAAASTLMDVAKELLSYFVDISNKECFAAPLYICFNSLRSDIVEEGAWPK